MKNSIDMKQTITAPLGKFDIQAQGLFNELYSFVNKFKKSTGDVDIYFHINSDPSGYLAHSPFVLTFEGGEFYYAMNNHSMFGWVKKDYNKRARWVGRFNAIVDKYGYYTEKGTSWAIGFYKK